ncbi:MAG: hypothetical protein U0930_23845 [Pirellulales bacterium]
MLLSRFKITSLLATLIATALVTSGLAFSLLHQQPQDGGSTKTKIRKPQMSDTIKANVYADNWFVLYVNGELAAVDSIKFIPHNVISVDLLPTYPMTIAVMAKDNADPKTGMEYANTNIGDGGFCLKFGDGTVTDARWKAKKFSWGPIDRDTKNPTVKNEPVPENWFAVDFDDSRWEKAKEYSNEQVAPKQPFFEHDFEGAKFIWTDDIELDNTVIFRHVVQSPPDGKPRTDYSNLNNVVPEQPPRGQQPRGQRLK